jgi:hypothetical protein
MQEFKKIKWQIYFQLLVHINRVESPDILYDEYSDWKRFHHRSGWFPRVHIRSLDLLAAIIEFSVI